MLSKGRFERVKISARLAGLRVKWFFITLIQFFGFALILAGALPIFAPFIKASLSTGLPVFIAETSLIEFDLQSISSIAVGAIIVWRFT